MPDINQQLVLKEGEIFQFSEQTGDIDGDRPGSTQGLYYRDTRFLSLLTMTANGQPPNLLTFTGYQNFMATFQFANDIWSLPGDLIARQRTLSLRRSRFIGDALHERIGVVNYNRFSVPLDITLTFGSDFRDIFDIRGYYRAADARGDLLEPVFEDGKVLLRYAGRDGVERATEIRFNRPPTSVSVEPPVCAWKRSACARGFATPKRSRMIVAQSRRAARNLATSSNRVVRATKKNASRGANASTAFAISRAILTSLAINPSAMPVPYLRVKTCGRIFFWMG